MHYVAVHALGLGVILLAFEAAGTLVARVAPAIDRVGWRTGLIRMTVGVAAWAYGLFGLAAVGLLRRPILILTMAVVVIAGGAAALRKGKQSRGSNEVHTTRGARWPWLAHAIAWLPLGIVFALLFVRTLSPWLGWDDMVAHLTLPKIYLAHGGFRRVPFNVYSNWPLNVELLYGLALAVQDYALAKLVHFGFLLLLAIAVYRFAARSAAPWAGFVAASLLLANDVVLVEATSANIDIAVAFFFFMATTLALEFRESGTRRSLILAGVFCGCMAGSKVTGLAAIACLLPLIVGGTLARQSERRLSALASDAVLFVASAVALALPWLIKSYVYTGDPLYPVLWKYLGGREWTATVDEQFWRWHTSIGMGRTLRDYALLPLRVILWGGGDYRHFGAWISKAWILVLPITIVFTPVVPLARRCLIPAALYFIVWALTSQQTRFLISVLPLLAVAAAATLAWIVGRRARGVMMSRALVGATLAGCVALLGWTSRYTVPPAVTLWHDFTTHPPDLQTWVPNPAYSYIRRNLSPSAKLMLLNTNHGFFLDRDYIADSFFEASQLKELIGAAGGRDGLTELFHELGVTHVLVDRDPWVSFPPALWEYLGSSETAKRLYAAPDGSLTVYELTSRPAG